MFAGRLGRVHRRLPAAAAGVSLCPSVVGSNALRSSSSDTHEKKVGYFGWLREVFSEERMKVRNESLRDELRRGYVNDFKELKSNRGKAFRGSEKMSDPQASVQFPLLELISPSGQIHKQIPMVSEERAPVQAALVCIAFRNGAEDMLASWSEPFKAQFSGRSTTKIYELSMVDSAVMGMWPFKNMILQSSMSKRAAAEASSEAASARHPVTELLFHFGESRDARKALGITNLLAGYVYLLDTDGRVRWRGSGMAEAWELEVLLSGARKLVDSAER